LSTNNKKGSVGKSVHSSDDEFVPDSPKHKGKPKKAAPKKALSKSKSANYDIFGDKPKKRILKKRPLSDDDDDDDDFGKKTKKITKRKAPRKSAPKFSDSESDEEFTLNSKVLQSIVNPL